MKNTKLDDSTLVFKRGTNNVSTNHSLTGLCFLPSSNPPTGYMDRRNSNILHLRDLGGLSNPFKVKLSGTVTRFGRDVDFHFQVTPLSFPSTQVPISLTMSLNAMHTNSSLGRSYGIFLHALALYGLLAIFYTLRPTSIRGLEVSNRESNNATLRQTAIRPPTKDKQEITTTEWTFNATRDGDNLGLSEEQCNLAFPKQYADIQNNVANLTSKPITRSDLDTQDQHDNRIRAIIYNGELYIISRHGEFSKNNGLATLHALQRALVAFPDRRSLPNIEFFIFSHDLVGENKAVWTYTKPAQDSEFKNQWLMPDFGFWAWPHARIRSYNHIRNEMRRFEDQAEFEDKIPQLVWRGNKGTAPHRPPFLQATEGKDWANVSDVGSSFLDLWDHCRFKMVMDISGRSWSGKGKYIQNCQSVYVTHTPMWMTTITYPLEADGANQNYVQVNKDWSDLEQKIKEVLQTPGMAERIAKKGVEDFRDRYLTPAAEACYWRALIRGYGKVSFEPNFYEKDGTTLRGVPYENVAMSPNLNLKKWWEF